MYLSCGGIFILVLLVSIDSLLYVTLFLKNFPVFIFRLNYLHIVIIFRLFIIYLLLFILLSIVIKYMFIFCFYFKNLKYHD